MFQHTLLDCEERSYKLEVFHVRVAERLAQLQGVCAHRTICLFVV